MLKIIFEDYKVVYKVFPFSCILKILNIFFWENSRKMIVISFCLLVCLFFVGFFFVWGWIVILFSLQTYN